MFTKLHIRVRVLEVLNQTVPCLVANKKIVNGDTELPYDFSIIQLHPNALLDLYDLNTYIWWRS